MRTLIAGLVLGIAMSGSCLAQETAPAHIILMVRACETAHKDRCATFRMRDSGPVEACQEEQFDVTDSESKEPMTRERCDMGGPGRAIMTLERLGITVCGSWCEVVLDSAGKAAAAR